MPEKEIKNIKYDTCSITWFRIGQFEIKQSDGKYEEHCRMQKREKEEIRIEEKPQQQIDWEK